MAAITGFERDSKPLKASFSRASFFSTTRSRTAANSLTSEPAQKALSPAPVTMTARTHSSPSRTSRASMRLRHLQCDQVERRVVQGELRDAPFQPLQEHQVLSGHEDQRPVHGCDVFEFLALSSLGDRDRAGYQVAYRPEEEPFAPHHGAVYPVVVRNG